MPWSPVDESDDGFGWIQQEKLQRTSHALLVTGHVWLIDPVAAPELEQRVRALGEPAGVLQLLDRHNRDCSTWASILAVPHHRAWESVDGTPFEALPVRDNRFWREVAVWEPVGKTLVCADALGTLPYFRVSGERIGVHPLLRFAPPRALTTVEPEHVLVGHGGGLHQDAGRAVRDTITHARGRIPAALVSAVRAVTSS